MRDLSNALAGMRGLKRTGTGYVGTCPACGYKDALSAAQGHDGKPLLYCHVGCSFESLADALGLSTSSAPPAPRRHPKSDSVATKDDRKEIIQRLFARSIPADRTVVSDYLAGRGINGTVPPDIRFLRQHRHAPSGLVCPVMLSLVRNVTDDMIGLHRTFLKSNGEGKADVVPAKMTLGRIGGGAVRLRRSNADLTELAISEGIETGLSVAQATGFQVWAALSAGGIEQLVLPQLPDAKEILIFADRDHHGRGQRAAEHAAARFLAEGRRVRIVLPSTVGTDFNDMLQEAG